MSTLKAINLQHPSSANNNIVLDSAGNITIANNLVVTGTLTIGNNINVPFANAVIVNTTSGTSIDFTGIPTNAKKIHVINSGLSVSSSDSVKLQVGVGGTPVTSGYYSSYLGFGLVGNTSSLAAASFLIPGNNRHGINSLYTFINYGGNEWIAIASGTSSLNVAANYVASGNITLSGPIDMIRVSANSTGEFVGGRMTVAWET